ncbi:hypothetical protein F4680DRAFT_471026 [Xylaria scruposa]|nr:hypothetical protein F4680DRAFT_471026 [Xylaria scruposa]
MTIGSPWTISAAWSTNANFRVRLHDLVTEWTATTTGYDISTHLALLEIIISLVCCDEYSDIAPDVLTVAAQISHSIIENDPEAMKTRPFIEWMLAECANAELGSRYQLQRQEDHLDNSPGVPYRRSRRNLAQYVPYKTENPGWICEDGPSELQDSARLALKISKNLNDYRTQAQALQLLILILASPIKEFEELETLQRFSQGDNYNVSETLAAKYLISNDDASKRKLKNELADQWCIPGFFSGFSAHQHWILSMIRRALTCDDVLESERVLRDADAWYKSSNPKFVEYVDTKMPTRRNTHLQNNETRTTRLNPARRRSNRRDASSSPIPELRQHSKAERYGRQGREEYEEVNDHEWDSIWQGGSRLQTVIRVRDSRIPTRTSEGITLRIRDKQPYQPPTTSHVTQQSRVGYVEARNNDDIEYRRERPFVVHERSLDRDVKDIHAPSSRQEPPIVEKSEPETQIPRSMPLGRIILTDQDIHNESGSTDAASISKSLVPVDDDHGKHAQNTVQINPNQTSPDNYALVPLGGNYEFEGVEEVKETRHEEPVKPKESTSFYAGSLMDFDGLKPPSRTVTMESVKDAGEEA